MVFDFYQRRKLKTVLESPLTRVILVLLVLLMGWSAYTRWAISSDMEQRRADVERELDGLKKQREGLEKQVQYLSDDRGIEAEMRRQFDVALNNEQVVVIVEPEEDEIKSASGTYQNIEETAWYEFWR